MKCPKSNVVTATPICDYINHHFKWVDCTVRELYLNNTVTFLKCRSVHIIPLPKAPTALSPKSKVLPGLHGRTWLVITANTLPRPAPHSCCPPPISSTQKASPQYSTCLGCLTFQGSAQMSPTWMPRPCPISHHGANFFTSIYHSLEPSRKLFLISFLRVWSPAHKSSMQASRLLLET